MGKSEIDAGKAEYDQYRGNKAPHGSLLTFYRRPYFRSISARISSTL
jgi:hypothetical protein